jgi:phospholipase C
MACLVGALPAAGEISKIRHVVIVVQENRTPDNLFHGLKAVQPAADVADSGIALGGEAIHLTRVPLANGYDLDHNHAAFVAMYDGGRMDGAELIKCHPRRRECPRFPQFKYVHPRDVRPYLLMAEIYGFANRMFQSNQGPSFPAHQFLLSGTSQVRAESPMFAAENPHGGAGCAALAQARVRVIDPAGVEARSVFRCFEHKALTDLFDRRRPPISWRYYTPSAGSIWTAPNAIRHICRPSDQRCTGRSWTNGSIDLEPSDVLRDIDAGDLPAVSWVIPKGQASDHPGTNKDGGPSWVASIVNEIGKSSYWEDTVILVTWDDWGGWYDHVRPPIKRGYGYYEDGFRVPLVVVSAYAKPHYVSEETHDAGSVLKFVERVFGLPLIPPGTFADSRADDLNDFFDFHAAPRKFTPIPAPRGANFFLNDKAPALDPDDD